MKKSIFLIAYVAIFLTGLFSCKKDELDLDKNLKFSKLTVEDQKKKIEENGLQFVEKMEGLKETQAYKTILNLSEETEAIDAPEIHQLKSAMESRDSKNLDKLRRQLMARAQDEDIWGEYDWNDETGEFEKSSGSSISGSTNTLILNFPASENAKSNNATLTLTYDESKVMIPEEAMEDVEGTWYYPSKMTCSLKVDGETAMKAEFTGEYNSDGTPTKAKNTLEIGDYSWVASMVNSTTEFSEEYVFKYKKEVLIKILTSAQGDLTVDNLEEMEDPSDALDKVVMYYQIMDIAVVGGINDMDAFADAMNAIDEGSDEEDYYEEEAAIVNQYLILYAYSVDDNRKLADVEFYVKETTDTHEELVWNGSDYVYQEVTDTDYELMPRMILSDGSKVDMEEYFETGFDELIDELEDLTEGIYEE